MIHTYEKILEKLKERYERVTANAEAWKKVVIKKKKNGEEYKKLTKACLTGGELYNESWQMRRHLTVFYKVTVNGSCISDSDSVGVSENRYVDNPLYSPAQVREIVEKRINELELEAKAILDAMEYGEKAYQQISDAVDVASKAVKAVNDRLGEVEYNGLKHELRNAIPHFYIDFY